MKKYHAFVVFTYLFLAFAFFVAFGVSTYLVREDLLRQIDFTWLVKIQDEVPRTVDGLLELFNRTGSFWVMAPFVFIVCYMTKRLWGFVAFFMFGVGHLLEVFLKIALHQPGPPFLFHRNFSDFYFDKAYVIPGSSYPSGHSMRAVFASVVFTYLIWISSRIPVLVKIFLCIGIIGWTILIILSKAVFGEHWPSDLVGGALLGAGLGFVTLVCLSSIKK